jgi:diaminopimelate decarboxylase
MNTINGIDIRQLSDEFGTPLYVYDADKIKSNYHKLKDTFQKYYPKTKIHYSVKANSNLSIIKLFNELDSGVDCSSPIEIFLAEKAGVSHDKILYTGNYESPDDFRALRGKNIKLNLDDINSFHRLIKIFTPNQIAFRINPGIGRGGYEGITTAGTDAKFGVPYERAYDAYKLAMQSGIENFGIHMMTGSNNLEPYYFAEVVEKLMKIAGYIFGKLGIQPQYIDIGGGMGIPYEQDEDELNVDLMAEMVTEIFKEKCEKYNFGEPDLLMEPGRYFVANAGYLITSVTGIKNSYKTFVGVDAGMSTLLRPALYGANHKVFVYGKEELEQNVNLCGQICENSDIFAKNVFMPIVEEGDLLVFADVGAYGYVMSSNYNNRLRPAEVLLKNGNPTLIRRREKIEDMLALYENL